MPHYKGYTLLESWEAAKEHGDEGGWGCDFLLKAPTEGEIGEFKKGEMGKSKNTF